MFIPIIKLHNWIYKNKYDEHSIDLLKKNNDIRINWSYLILTTVDKLKENNERVNWAHIANNPSKVKVLKEDIDNIEKNDKKNKY
jgi:hypothetical protein